MASIRQTEVDLLCPHCGQKLRKTLGWLYDHDSFVCVPCGTEISLHEKEFCRIDEPDEETEALRYAINRFDQ